MFDLFFRDHKSVKIVVFDPSLLVYPAPAKRHYTIQNQTSERICVCLKLVIAKQPIRIEPGLWDIHRKSTNPESDC